VYAYARVSTREQDLTVQKNEILKYVEYRQLDLVRLFEDKFTGTTTDRPGFGAMMATLEENPQGIEAVVVWKLDRLGRSLSDLVRIVARFKEMGIELIFIGNNIDTTTKEGRLQFHIMGALAEYEREMILERTSLGRQIAKEKGVRFGPKPRKLPMAEIVAKIALGVSKSRIASDYKIDRSTLTRRLKEYERKQQDKALQTAMRDQVVTVLTSPDSEDGS
jgi:DNA invertase Pin-like site-specific DNA recombinase